METITVTTTQNIGLEYELASIWDRIAGRIIDGLIIAAYAVLIAIVFFSNSTLLEYIQWWLIIFVLPVFFYDLAFEVWMNGQSIGKRVMHIKVISLNGGQPTLGQYLIRWVFRLVDFTLTSSVCALISVAVSERRQRVGDMVAGTTLIRTIPRTALQETMYAPAPNPDYIVSFPEVIHLSDKDVQLIKEVILTVRSTGNTGLAYKAALKISETLNIQTSMDPMHFLQVLIQDYNHLTSSE